MGRSNEEHWRYYLDVLSTLCEVEERHFCFCQNIDVKLDFSKITLIKKNHESEYFGLQFVSCCQM